ncbi:hypothetical protein HN51_049810 [Arachis hypogaea]|nr:neuropeptide-like protein 32 [Arachis hypogaea]
MANMNTKPFFFFCLFCTLLLISAVVAIDQPFKDEKQATQEDPTDEGFYYRGGRGGYGGGWGGRGGYGGGWGGRGGYGGGGGRGWGGGGGGWGGQAP